MGGGEVGRSASEFRCVATPLSPRFEERPLARNEWPFGPEVLVERYVPGRELTVAVLGDRPLTVTEIRPRHGFYDCHAKYTEQAADHLIRRRSPTRCTNRRWPAAQTAHRLLGCRGVSRADFRLDDTEPDGLYLLEVNTQPGMTPLSLVPEQAARGGIGFADLVVQLVEGRDATCDARRPPGAAVPAPAAGSALGTDGGLHRRRPARTRHRLLVDQLDHGRRRPQRLGWRG